MLIRETGHLTEARDMDVLRKAHDRSILVASTAVAIGLAVAAVIFAHAYGTLGVSNGALALHEAESILGSATVTTSAVREALLVGEVGAPAEGVAADALARAGTILDDLDRRLDSVDDPEVRAAGRQLVRDGRTVLALVKDGDLDGAAAQLTGSYALAYNDLVARAGSSRDAALGEVESARATAGRLAQFSRFMVAFVLPLIGLILVRRHFQRRTRQAELQALLEAEREISRSKDEFIANISHELRTPLTAIYGFSRVLEEDGFQDPETSLDLINLIIGESGELSRMVDDLLTAARADAGVLGFSLEPVFIVQQVRDVVAPFERSGPSIHVDCEDIKVIVDAGRLRQVLRNLISNARRHGGPRVQVLGRSRGGSFEIIVADNGPGVLFEGDPFERFSGSKRRVGDGVGIGLSISKSLVEGMGGRLEYRRRNGWTEFVVRMPLDVDQTPAELEAAPNLHLLRKSEGEPLEGEKQGRVWRAS